MQILGVCVRARKRECACVRVLVCMQGHMSVHGTTYAAIWSCSWNHNASFSLILNL